MKRLLGIAVLAGLTGCVTMQPKEMEYKIASDFNIEFARNQIADGLGEINGTAFLTQKGGGVVTCAGQDVHLFPVTEYASDRVSYLYGGLPSLNRTVTQNIRNVLNRKPSFVPDPPEYKEYSKVTKCDANGEFQFSQVKDGEYYINTAVYWQAQTYQGGLLLTRAKVEDGKSPRIIMTR
ncbi:hypothetical protein ACVTTK_05500 [Alcaligenes nematophilus]|uniref:hypothetical protein n=1 Tax=Alcaligenes nematophilus TaxID=2994643 RepID=UPI00384DCF52